MFTIEQIKTVHSKVKSGADFPAYIQEMKALGVIAYEHFVADGRIAYYGTGDFKIAAAAKWAAVEIAETGSQEKLQQALTIHQHGKTDYSTFCNQSAQAGIEKWIVDITKMTCTYYDKAGTSILTEEIPIT